MSVFIALNAPCLKNIHSIIAATMMEMQSEMVMLAHTPAVP